MSENTKIRVGIAGLGRSGWDIHARLLGPLSDKYSVVGALDQNPARLKEAADKFGCRTHAAFDELLANEDVELVVVATPSHLHTEQTLAALNAGKHVVCEKPMAMSVKDADRMVACAKRKKRVLSIFQNRRYQKDFVQIRRVIESGVLGRIMHVRMAYHGFRRRWDWQTLKKYGGGSLRNTGPHAIDQAVVLFGDRQPKVFCLRDRTLTLGDADDHVKLILHGEGAPTIEIELFSACAYAQEPWLVMGTQGGLAGTDKELRWKHFNPKDLPPRTVSEEPTPDRSYNNEPVPWVEHTWLSKDDTGPGEKGFYLDLYETIRNGKPLQIRPEEIRRQLWIIEQCQKQAPI